MRRVQHRNSYLESYCLCQPPPTCYPPNILDYSSQNSQGGGGGGGDSEKKVPEKGRLLFCLALCLVSFIQGKTCFGTWLLHDLLLPPLVVVTSQGLEEVTNDSCRSLAVWSWPFPRGLRDASRETLEPSEDPVGVSGSKDIDRAGKCCWLKECLLLRSWHQLSSEACWSSSCRALCMSRSCQMEGVDWRGGEGDGDLAMGVKGIQRDFQCLLLKKRPSSTTCSNS